MLDFPDPSSLGTVIWITGLSGAGKSTIATSTYQLLKAELDNTVLLDGDAFRLLMDEGLGHDSDSRIKNAFRISKFCKLLSDQGKNITKYIEVYIKVPLSTLKVRDSKGLYSKALSGLDKSVVGIDLPFEEPK